MLPKAYKKSVKDLMIVFSWVDVWFQPADVAIIKTMKNPPSGVKLVMAAVCVMKDIKPEKINDPAGTGQKVITSPEKSHPVIYQSWYFLTAFYLYIDSWLLGSKQEATGWHEFPQGPEGIWQRQHSCESVLEIRVWSLVKVADVL